MKLKVFALSTFFCFSFLLGHSQTKMVNVAKKHYSKEDISKMSEKEIKKINYYYSETYKIDASHKFYNDFVKEFCGEEFDVTKFEKYRKQSYTNWWATEKYPGLKVYLVSWDEINNKYKEIENQ